MPTPIQKYFSITEVSEILNISPDTLRRIEKRGKIEPLKGAGGKRLYTLDDINLLRGITKKTLPDRSYTVEEAASILNVSKDTIRRWEASGKITAERTNGGHRRFSSSSLNNVSESAGNQTFASTLPVTEPGPEPQTTSKKITKNIKRGFIITAFALILGVSGIALAAIGINENLLPGLKSLLEETWPVIAYKPGLNPGDLAQVQDNGKIHPQLLPKFTWSLVERSIESMHINFGAITRELIANDSIDSSKIENNSITAFDLSGNLVFSNGDLIDLSQITHSTTSKQGIILPNTSSSSPSNPVSGEGYLAYNTNSNQVIVYNGTGWQVVGDGVGGSGSGDITAVNAGNGLTGGGDSDSVTLNVVTGNGFTLGTDQIDIDISTSGTTSTTSSNSGLETDSTGLSLIRGCADGEILKWNSGSALWECMPDSGGGGGGISTVQEGDTTVVASATVIDFLGADFIVGQTPAGEANVSIDYTNSKIVRSDQNEVITGTWTITASDLGCTNCIGATEISDLTLGTDTAGSYVATITSGNGVSGTASGEGSTPTLNLAALTGDWDQTGAFDIALNNSSSELKILESGSSPTLFGIFDVGDLSSSDSTYTFSGSSGTVLTSSNYTGTLDSIYVNVGESPAAGDISGSFSGGFTIGANTVALTTDTTGNYVATLTNGTGITGADGGSEGATLTLAIDQSFSPTWTGAHTFSNTLTANGDINLGNATTDTISVTGRIAQDSDILPITTTGTNDLGSASLPWDNIYAVSFIQNGNLVCDSSGANCPSGAGLWALASGALYPTNNSADLLVGATATTSAKFAFKNVLAGTPTASISGSTANVATFIDGNGNFSATNRANLTIGNSSTYNTTGNLLIHPNGTGNVAIGSTLNPGAKLDIESLSSGSSRMLTMRVPNAVNNNAQINFAVNESGTNIDLARIASAYDGSNQIGLAFSTWNGSLNERFRIAYDGKIGVGTSSPGTAINEGNPLMVVTGSGDVRMTINSTSNNAGFGLAESGTLRYSVASFGGGNFTIYDDVADAYRFYMTNAGNIGLGGTTGPDAKLDVVSTSGEQLRLTYTDGSVYTGFTTNSSGDLTVAPSGGDLSVTGNLSPTTDSTYNLGGSASLAWANIYGDSIYQSGNQVCDTSGNCNSVGNHWQLNSKVVSPANSTYDLAIGGTATSSAKFQAYGVETATGNIVSLTSNTITSGTLINATSSAITSGNFIKLGTGGDNGNFTGNGIYMDFDNTGGNSFTGNFLRFDNAASTIFSVGSAGDITTSGDLALNGGDLTSTVDLTIDSAGGNIIISDPINVGGGAANAYNFFSTSLTGVTSPDDASDLFIQDELEVEGSTRFDITGGDTITIIGTNRSTTAGLIDATASTTSSNTNVTALSISFTNNNDTNASETHKGQIISFDNDGTSADDNTYALVLENNSGSTASLDAGLYIDNANASLAISDGILFSNSGGAGYTDFIDTPSSVFKVDGSGNITGVNLNSTGNVSLGDAITDTITFTGRVAQDSDLIPIGTTGTNDLGSASLPWDNVYAVAFTQNGNSVCDTSGNCLTSANYWQLNSKVLSPGNSTYDLAVGGTATSSAKFQAYGIENTSGNIVSLTSNTITSGTLLNATASAITSGSFIKLGTGGDNGNFTGNGIWMDFDNTGGNSFTGNFLKFDNAASTIFTVASTGNLATSGDIAVNGGDVTSAGALNVTPGGALTLGSSGQTAEITSSSLVLDIAGTDEITLSSTALSPSTNDGSALGTSTLKWSDLFLASGSVINWNSSDILLTHSTDNLSLTGGSLSVANVDGRRTEFMGDGSPTVNIVEIGNGDISATPGVNSLAVIHDSLNASGDALNIFMDVPVADGGDTTNAINVEAFTYTSTGGTNTVRGLLVDDLTEGGGTINSYAIGLGTGWDIDINATSGLDIGIGGTGEVNLSASALSPYTSDGNALGTTSLMWSDLFLADGAVINWNNGDLTLTHTTDTLTLAGGNLSLGGNLAINGGTTIGDASGDTVTANAASWTFANDTNFTLSGGSNGLSFDTDTLSIDATNDRVGIGTGAPTETLEVDGNIKLTTNGQKFTSTNAAGNGNDIYVAAAANRWIMDASGGYSFNLDYDNNDTAAVFAVYTNARDGAGTNLLSLNETGNLTIGAFTSSGTAALCWDNSGASTINDCSGTPVADYAEVYPTSGNIEYGDILALTDTTTTIQRIETDRQGNTLDPKDQEISVLGKSTKKYNRNVIGVASQNWSDFSSTGHNVVSDSQNPIPVALSGRIPVKISQNSAPIKIGDFLATSDETGKAMKATESGPVIGKALESWNPGQKDKVLIFVNNTYYDHGLALDDNGDTEAGRLAKNGNEYEVLISERLVSIIKSFAKATIGNLTVGRAEAGVISPLANEDLVIDLTPENSSESAELNLEGLDGQIVASFDSEGNASFAGEIKSDSLNVGDATIEGTLYADNIESKKLNEIEEILKKVEENQALLSEASTWNTSTATDSGVIAEAAFGDLYVTDVAAIETLSVNSSALIGNDMALSPVDNSINSMAAPLRIQSFGMKAVEIMKGLITIDIEGNTKFAGNVEVKGELTINELKVSQESPAGRATIKEGEKKVKIESTSIKPGSIINLTPLSDTGNKVIYVIEEGEGWFEAGFNSETTKDIVFNWWVIETSQ